MTTMERTNHRQLRCEALNRAQQEIQTQWTVAERWHRRQLAECRQQALARLLLGAPTNRSSTRRPAR